MTEYERWHAMKLDDPDLTEELNAIEGNPEEINDRFYRELEFGTGGLRGDVYKRQHLRIMKKEPIAAAIIE